MDLDTLFDQVRYTAFRWEGRASYAVGGAEADRIQAWREHRPRPERSIRTNDYLRRIARGVLDGREWQRVTLRSDPPTEYQRYRTAGDLESQAAGEQVLVLVAGPWPAELNRAIAAAEEHLAAELDDFWLFDAGTDRAVAALMQYTPDGAFDQFHLVTDAGQLAALDAMRAALVAASVPLNGYLAAAQAVERTVA
jgi:hypothetical protein